MLLITALLLREVYSIKFRVIMLFIPRLLVRMECDENENWDHLIVCPFNNLKDPFPPKKVLDLQPPKKQPIIEVTLEY